MGDLFQPTHLILLLIMTPLFGVGLLPILVAGMRGVKNFAWIFAINVCFGWTLIGWIVALVWAIRDQPKYLASYLPPAAPPYNVR
jgi:hypothetical protein